MVCEKCSGSGKKAYGEYCDCVGGQLMKSMDRSAKRAERMKEKEQKLADALKAEKAEKTKSTTPTKKKTGIVVELPCKMFDWVEVVDGSFEGMIGVITDINMRSQKVLFEVVRQRDGNRVNGLAWIDWDDVEVLETIQDEDHLWAMIDMAIDKEDENWFMELTARLP